MTLFQNLAIALGLGLLVGLQREWATKRLAGIRTFPLIAILGVLAGLLSDEYGGWVLGAAVVALAVAILVGNLGRIRRTEGDSGLTTEVAVFVMFFVGVALHTGRTAESIAVGGGLAVLLHWKTPLHRFVRRIGEQDLRAVIRLVLIGLVVLPALPDRSYGPYHVLNPFEIWLMVVLIVGISLGAYVASRLLGARTGSLLAGLLGGLISSTATTVTYARLSRQQPGVAASAALVLMAASTIVFGRVLGEVAVVAPGILRSVGPPLAAMMAWMACVCVAAWVLARGGDTGAFRQEPPSELKAAIVFGLLYAVILVAVAAARRHFGEAGLYAVGALSGLTDMDAITLSTAQLVRKGKLEGDVGWRVILLGAMSNLVFKGCVVAALGPRALLRRLGTLFAVSLVGGALLLWLWP